MFPTDTFDGVDDSYYKGKGLPVGSTPAMRQGQGQGSGPGLGPGQGHVTKDYASFQRWWATQMGLSPDLPPYPSPTPPSPDIDASAGVFSPPQAGAAAHADTCEPFISFMEARTDPRAAFPPPGVKKIPGLTVVAGGRGARTGRDLGGICL